MHPFHYAFKVKDIDSTRKFYRGLLGCKEGRSTEHWIDFDFFGNQISAHVSDHLPDLDYCGTVDGVSVPIPHFGCIVDYQQFTHIQMQFETSGVKFIIAPQTRYKGLKGEQLTMFVLDFSGNPLEFKAFKDIGEIF
jgi:hypothetical protein